MSSRNQPRSGKVRPKSAPFADVVSIWVGFDRIWTPLSAERGRLSPRNRPELGRRPTPGVESAKIGRSLAELGPPRNHFGPKYACVGPNSAECGRIGQRQKVCFRCSIVASFGPLHGLSGGLVVACLALVFGLSGPLRALFGVVPGPTWGTGAEARSSCAKLLVMTCREPGIALLCVCVPTGLRKVTSQELVGASPATEDASRGPARPT